ncbi:MAG: hypothetical protein WCX30_00545 [Candidatus Paceibacterota bacterium]|jgi:hypothetical protein|nr:hypothetical protein [bacterium]
MNAKKKYCILEIQSADRSYLLLYLQPKDRVADLDSFDREETEIFRFSGNNPLFTSLEINRPPFKRTVHVSIERKNDLYFCVVEIGSKARRVEFTAIAPCLARA